MHTPTLAAPAAETTTDFEVLPPEAVMGAPGGAPGGAGGAPALPGPVPTDAVPLLPVDRVEMVNGLHEAARLSMAQGAAYMLLVGLELLALKKEALHGQFEELFEPEAGEEQAKTDSAVRFGFTARSARRYMALAKEGGKRIKVLEALKDTALSSLAPEMREQIIREVCRVMDGSTYAQMVQTWGLAKANRGAGARGGNLLADSAGGGGVVDTLEARQQQAVDIWRPIFIALAREGLKEQSDEWLPDTGEVSGAALDGLIVDLQARRAQTKRIRAQNEAAQRERVKRLNRDDAKGATGN